MLLVKNLPVGKQAPTAAASAEDFVEAPRRKGQYALETPPLCLFDQRLLHSCEGEKISF
jgi:hypothetical protein